jgi:predicted flap endonuclease-1-like 5' DNA nuclease
VSLSPRVRILAAAVFLAVAALAAGFMLLGGNPSSSQAALKTIKPLHPVNKAAKKAAQAKVPAKKPAKKLTPKRVQRAAKPKPTVIDGMPAALAHALTSHAVVVVSLYAPRSSVDAMATDEAKHGAALAGAGFVAFNVADEHVVSPLTSLLTGAQTAADRVLDGPAVLVFQRPRTLFVRFNGFADRDTVAQAAANAASLAS